MRNYTNIIFIASIICTLAIGSLYIWLLLNVNDNLQRVNSITIEVAESETKNNHAYVLKSLLDRTENNRNKLQALFVEPLEVADLLQTLESLSKNIGTSVEVKSIRDNGDSVSITTSVVGTFAQLIHFTRLTSTMPRAVFIESLHLNKQKGSKLWNGRVELIILKTSS